MITEGENFEVVNAELVGHVDTEALGAHWLQETEADRGRQRQTERVSQNHLEDTTDPGDPVQPSPDRTRPDQTGSYLLLCLLLLLHPSTLGDDELVAPFVDHTGTYCTHTHTHTHTGKGMVSLFDCISDCVEPHSKPETPVDH